MIPANAKETVETLAALFEIFERYRIKPVALTGGVAFSIWVTPRYTKDFDFCAVVPEEAVAKLLARFDGHPSGPERVPRIIRLRIGSWEVDVFVVHSEYDKECLARATTGNFLGLNVTVVSPEDLLIHKLIKLRDDKSKILQDASDIQAILAAHKVDGEYLARWLAPEQASIIESGHELSASELVSKLEQLR